MPGKDEHKISSNPTLVGLFLEIKTFSSPPTSPCPPQKSSECSLRRMKFLPLQDPTPPQPVQIMVSNGPFASRALSLLHPSPILQNTGGTRKGELGIDCHSDRRFQQLQEGGEERARGEGGGKVSLLSPPPFPLSPSPFHPA